MKSLHKFLAWVLALLILLSALASCKPAPDSLVEDTSLGETATEGETAPPRDPITYYFEDYVVEQPDTPPEVQEKPDTLYEFTQDFSEPIPSAMPLPVLRYAAGAAFSGFMGARVEMACL